MAFSQWARLSVGSRGGSLLIHEHGALPNVNIEATWQLQSCRSMNVSQDAAKEPVEESTLKVSYSNSLGLRQLLSGVATRTFDGSFELRSAS